MNLITNHCLHAAPPVGTRSTRVPFFGMGRRQGRGWNASLPVVLAVILAGGTAASAPDNTGAGRADYTGFKIISDRNIFNASRSGRFSGTGDDQKPIQVDTVILVGTLTYEKGPYAFFDGSDATFQQVLEPGQLIAGYTIAQIQGDVVRMTAGTNNLELHVGMQLRREEGGDWKVSGGSSVQASVGAGRLSSGSSGDDGDDAVVKRLMKQREQELK